MHSFDKKGKMANRGEGERDVHREGQGGRRIRGGERGGDGGERITFFKAETACYLGQQRCPFLLAQAEEAKLNARDALGSTEALQATSPATISEAIERIGSGPFQTRVLIICGMVRRSRGLLFGSRQGV